MTNRTFYDTQEFSVTVAAGAISGTVADPVNPLRGTLLHVEAQSPADASATNMRLKLTRNVAIGNVDYSVYESANTAIPLSGGWEPADGANDVRVHLNYNRDGNYTWAVYLDVACTTEKVVKIVRTIRV